MRKAEDFREKSPLLKSPFSLWMELGLLSTTGMLSQEMLELIHPELVLEDLPYPIMFRLKKEVDQIFSDAVAAGAFPVKKSQPASWGGYSGYFRDLDG